MLSAEAFFAAAQAGEQQDAARAADIMLRDPSVEERTVAYAALTYLHAGRFRAAKEAIAKLAPAHGPDALWAKAAMAVAFKTDDVGDAIATLATMGQATPEFRLLAGVAAYQNNDRETGDQWLEGLQINPMSVFSTAAMLGMRRASQTGTGARVLQISLGVAGFFLLGVLGAAGGLAAGEAINRSRMRSRVGAAASTLLQTKPPTERHSPGEIMKFLGKGLLVFVAIAAVVLLIAALLN